jgi:tRNA threonylcarbamoyl adenosine modification protein YeaZ
MNKKRTLLYIDTVTQAAQLGILVDEKYSSVPFREVRSYSKDLIQIFDRAVKKAKIRPETLDAVVVITGPGSYTSIRIGVSFANAVAFSLGIPVHGITVFEAVRALTNTKAPILVEAGRENLFVAKGKSETVLSREALAKKKVLNVLGFQLAPETMAALKNVHITELLALDVKKLVQSFLGKGKKKEGRVGSLKKPAIPHYVIPPHISKHKKRKFF